MVLSLCFCAFVVCKFVTIDDGQRLGFLDDGRISFCFYFFYFLTENVQDLGIGHRFL